MSSSSGPRGGRRRRAVTAAVTLLAAGTATAALVAGPLAPERDADAAALTLPGGATVPLAPTGTDSGAPTTTPPDVGAPNRTMSGGVSTCVAPRRRTLRGYTFDGRAIAFRVQGGREPRCRSGKLRILRVAPLLVNGEVTYVRRGGCDRPEPHDHCARQPTAHLRASDLEPVTPAPEERNGNGAPRADCDRAARNRPSRVRRVLDQMYYKQPSDLPGRSISGARWSNYGNPGRRFRTRDMNYLLWNLPRTADGVLPGGGIVEAVLGEGERLLLCGAPALTLPSFDAAGRRNGRVRFAYAKVGNGREEIYGWVLLGYRRFGQDPVRTVLPEG